MKVEGLILDIDGTLWRGAMPLGGQRELMEFLGVHEIPFVVATNNTKSPQHYQQLFRQQGVEIDASRIVTASDATASYVAANFPKGSRIYVIGYGDLQKAVEAQGFTVVSDAHLDVAAVVVGGDFALTYTKLRDAIQLVLRGAPLVGSNPDLLLPTEEGLVPEAGTFIAAIEAATGKIATIIGKPKPYLFMLAVQRMGLGSGSSNIVVAGDRLDTDVLGAKNAGFTSALICTGVDSLESVATSSIQPDHVFPNLFSLTKWLGANTTT